MAEKDTNTRLTSYNSNPNLDYTIDLDGSLYNVTAADSAWADTARKVEHDLTVTEVTAKTDNTGKILLDSDDNAQSIETDKIFDGSVDIGTSVVPSSGGVFTGHISVPNITEDDLKKYQDSNGQETSPNGADTLVMNRGCISHWLDQLKGFPSYRWDGNTLEQINNPDDGSQLAAFKVVLYNDETCHGAEQANGSYKYYKYGPAEIRFQHPVGTYIECYFLAINEANGWMSLGHCYSDETQVTTYLALGVANAYTLITNEVDDDDNPIVVPSDLLWQLIQDFYGRSFLNENPDNTANNPAGGVTDFPSLAGVWKWVLSYGWGTSTNILGLDENDDNDKKHPDFNDRFFQPSLWGFVCQLWREVKHDEALSWDSETIYDGNDGNPLVRTLKWYVDQLWSTLGMSGNGTEDSPVSSSTINTINQNITNLNNKIRYGIDVPDDAVGAIGDIYIKYSTT